MKKIKIFISSVQSEFVTERQMLYDYLTTDALLGKFFEPFVFEKLPATGQNSNQVYLNEVKMCDIYLGLFGKEYGYEDKNGLSPTEHEFDEATKQNKMRLIFLSQHTLDERHPKERQLIIKAEKEVVRKKFASEIELKTRVYAALIRYLEEKEFIRTGPFDASACAGASLDDLDFEKIAEFVRTAKAKRGFPLSAQSKPDKILTHLNLLRENGITNAAMLLFGKQPQRFIISSEIRCVQFHGNEIVKPIPAYQVYKGDVFQLVNQAADFILSRINASVGTRSKSVQAPLQYEIPPAAISEAIVNALAHRDYTSNGSVQVMLFRDRLEVWNPGNLPYGLTTAKLRKPHHSIPANPLLAEPMYLAGYIERMGTGTGDIIRLCKKTGLKEPEFVQEDIFKVIIWRKQVGDRATDHDTDHDTDHVGDLVKKLVVVMSGEMSRPELQEKLGIKHIPHFRNQYLTPALEIGIIEMTLPDKIKSKNQKYRLTTKGVGLQKRIKQ